jgi:hypothetical protein
MRLIGTIAAALAAPALLLAGCGGPEDPMPQAAMTPAAQGDDALIAAAQTISNAIGGCFKPEDAQVESRVIGLEEGSIVMLACGQGAYSFTHRLFVMRGVEGLQLLSLPDYDSTGWFASDQASMAEIDAGTGVLTTMRKSAGHGGCGAEGRYQWDGVHFALQEMRWKDCSADDMTGPPYPVIWPTQQGAAVDPNGATPAP